MSKKAAICLALAALTAFAIPASAEDKTGKWEVSVGWFIHETQTQEMGIFPRAASQIVPEDLAYYDVNDYWGVRSDAAWELGVTYHFNRWFDIELNYNQFSSNLGTIPVVYLTNRTWVNDIFVNYEMGPTTILTYDQYDVGQIDERTFMVSAKFRFNTDSRWNPYVAVGIGTTDTNVEWSSDMAALRDYLAASDELIWISDAFEANPGLLLSNSPNIIYESDQDAQCVDWNLDGVVDWGTCYTGGTGLLTMNYDGGFAWQLRAGMEYQLGPHMVVYGEAKYTFINGDIEILINGQKQFMGVAAGDNPLGWYYLMGLLDYNILDPASHEWFAGQAVVPLTYVPGGDGAYLVSGGKVGQDNFQVGGGFRWTF